MTKIELAGYKLFDYERDLAGRESTLLTATAAAADLEPAAYLRERGTYFQTIDGVRTSQRQTEDIHLVERGSRSARQATRYLVHGLHEYKGKFNPQMARALINVVDPTATALLDPFAGSGTSLVEGMRLGLATAGIDQNPLAAWVARIKTTAMAQAGQAGLAKEFDDLASRARLAMKEGQDRGTPCRPHFVTAQDATYLKRWFPPAILAALWDALVVCRQQPGVVADVVEVCLSNIVRQVSWQLPEDLRIRRRPADWTHPNVAELFAGSADRGLLAMTETEHAPPMEGVPAPQVRCGSSREAGTVAEMWPEGRRMVVTSPPYATALPYVDTDRLSIVLMGLASASSLRDLDQTLTGSREWSTREAIHWRSRWRDDIEKMPLPLLNLLDTIQAKNDAEDAGFRRQAVPALLYRYFAYMGQTFAALRASMTEGEKVVMVVGVNRTGPPSTATTIDTPDLLGAVSERNGFHYEERLPLQAWSRYGMHAHNAVASEAAVIMKAAATA